MCKRCVATEPLSRDGVVAHIGYGDPAKDNYEKLLEDDIVIESDGTNRRLSQSDYLAVWDKLRTKPGFGELDPHAPPEENFGCAICEEYLVTVPGVDAECEGCHTTKHETIRSFSEHRDQIRADMEAAFGGDGIGPGKRNDPIELAIRAGLHCPNGHWVCSDCLVNRRDRL